MKANYKKEMAIAQILIIILASFTISLISSAKPVEAANVCCEKTKTGDFCQQTDDANCDPAFKQAATSCAQTSFCRPVCCFNPRDSKGEETGLCYSNYPKTTCDNYKGQADIGDASCLSSSQCQEGCCIIGTQAQYITQQRCKLETANFPDLQMDFKPEVKSEADCLDIVRSKEKGCCVTDENNAVYTTRDSCSTEQSLKTGFFKGEYCSQLDFVKCAPGDPNLKKKGAGNPKDTGCLPDEEDVYWMDSCGNPEGVKEDCDYVKGNLCGDSDGDGKYTCEDLNCNPAKMSFSLKDYFGTEKSKIEINQKGNVMQGQSWCLFDSDSQDLRSAEVAPVGSRYYRSLCVNGKEIVEPCQDFRKEWCLDGQAEIKDESGAKYEFTEARCRENRWQSCIDDCNTVKDLNAVDDDEDEIETAIENDAECCLNTDKRECEWIGPTGEVEENVGAFGSGSFGGYCIPSVKPGTKFWEDEGSDNCGKASLECEVTFRCPGVKKLLGYVTGDECTKGLFSKQGWEIIQGSECLSPTWITAANSLCRSVGDCGADYNIDGTLSMDGFSNTEDISDDFENCACGKDAECVDDFDCDGPGELSTVTTFGGAWWKFNENDEGKIQRFLGDSAASLITSGLIGTFSALAFKKIAFTGFSNLLGASTFTSTLESFLGPLPFGGGGLGSIYTSELTDAAINEIKGDAFTNTFKNTYSEQVNKMYLDKLSTEGIDPIYADGKLAIRSGTEGLYDQAGKEATKLATDEGKWAANNAVNNAQATTGFHFAQALNAIMWAYTAYNLINIFMEGTETATVSTTCGTWVAPTPTAGTCERCNANNLKEGYGDKDGKALSAKALKECSEYRCKSFGQACSIINEGTENQTCVSLEPYDVKSPVIDFWKDGTKVDAKCITNKGKGIGFEIKNTKECLIPAYERVNVGISTDEPAQCKLSFKNNVQYDQMESFFFGTQQYVYFHQQVLTYPQTANVTGEGPQLGQADNTYKLYVRCKDALNNDNERDYTITFSVDKGPDLTAPKIEFTSIPQNTYLAAGQNGTDVTLYINEPAECKWNQYDLDYDTMGLNNTCRTRLSTSFNGLYDCIFKANNNLAAGEGPQISGASAVNQLYYFYFRCKDQPTCVNNKDPTGRNCTRNTNKDSFQLSLRTSENLTISSVSPLTGSDMFIGEAGANVSLDVETDNGALRNGNAFCLFTTNAGEKNNIIAMTPFFNTNASLHSQVLTPSTGTQTYYIGCTDVAGNLVYNQTSFNVKIDQQAPLIVRAFEDTSTSPSTFKIETDEQAVCEYTTDKAFTYGTGNLMQPGENNQHIAPTGFTTYYIICQDIYKNTGPVTTISLLK